MKPINEIQTLTHMAHSVRKCLTMAASSSYTSEDVYRLLSEYIHHSFPSKCMSYPAFESWAKAVGALSPAQNFSYFNTMVESNGDFMTFYDFLTGLVVGDPKAELDHDRKLSKLRQMYIMTRYLPLRNVLELSHQDTKHLVDDLLRIAPIEINGSQTTSIDDVIANIQSKLNIGTPFKLTFTNFSAAVNQNLVGRLLVDIPYLIEPHFTATGN